MRVIKKIIVHCTDSNWGDLEEIKRWHKERGFDDIGYHYVILNGFLKYKDWKEKDKKEQFDGVIIAGRDEAREGAHCHGHNKDSIGIALVGTRNFTIKQLQSLELLCVKLIDKYNLSWKDVYGHYEFNENKTCPNLDVGRIREVLRLRYENK